MEALPYRMTPSKKGASYVRVLQALSDAFIKRENQQHKGTKVLQFFILCYSHAALQVENSATFRMCISGLVTSFRKDKKMLEDVQKFGLRMSTKHWDLEYSILLHELYLESLERHRGIARLCLLYIRLLILLCYFNSNVFNFCNSRTYHSHSLSLIPPFSRTNSYFHSFVPNTIYMWNMLDMSVVSAPSPDNIIF